MNSRRPPLIMAFIVIVIGSIGLVNLSGKPRFASFQSVDVLQLLASGMCFGLALAIILLRFRQPWER